MPSTFVNEPFTDFTDASNAGDFKKALDLVKSQLGRDYPLYIGGEKVTSGETFTSVNPSNPSEIIGTVAEASQAHAEQAIQAATKAFATWQYVDAAERAEYLFKAAKIVRDRKHEFSAWMVLEVGKSWAEADADTAECVDFLEFYGREMLRLAETQPVTPLPGEDNQMVYIPLGVTAVIPPWNFPLAIMAGMTTAAVVAGNTVCLKPSPDAPVIAAKFMEVLEEVGLPAGVVNYVPGDAIEVGEFLVTHPQTRVVAFTGSKAVGLRINAEAAKTQPGQKWIKRAILEMGGKDAIVVDSDVDLDWAVTNVVASAFGFNGQKCSACSRAIIHEDVYDEFVEKMMPKVKAIKQGNPADGPDMYMGPVVNTKAVEKILSYIDTGKNEGNLLTGGARGDGDGYFIQPTVFDDVAPDARISQEEIFGPVVALIKAKSFEHALEIANGTEYGLTGAVFSNNRDRWDQARDQFHVGNLYFNRKCTGALVGVHPFGGFNMSGTDSKAGGRDYLLLFTQAKTMSEIRR